MVKRVGGVRRKTRYKYQKEKSEKGKLSIRRFFQELKPGERVVLKMEPSYHKGIYHARYHGKSGIVKRKLKNCYEVVIKDGSLEKTLIIHPIHLIKQKQA